MLPLEPTEQQNYNDAVHAHKLSARDSVASYVPEHSSSTTRFRRNDIVLYCPTGVRGAGVNVTRGLACVCARDMFTIVNVLCAPYR